jgi:hypothetical protein
MGGDWPCVVSGLVSRRIAGWAEVWRRVFLPEIPRKFMVWRMDPLNSSGSSSSGWPWRVPPRRMVSLSVSFSRRMSSSQSKPFIKTVILDIFGDPREVVLNI